MVTIVASEYTDPGGLIVKSGERIASRAIEILRSGETTVIQLKGLHGISSSYFNAFLRLVCDELGSDALGRVQFEFISPLQRDIYQRSLDAMMRISLDR